MADSVPEQILQALVSLASASGWYGITQTFEPKSAPTAPIHFSINITKATPLPSQSLIESGYRIEYGARSYVSMLREPQDDIDGDLMAASWDLLMAITHGFSLGSLAREVDLLGEFGDPLQIEYGYVTIEKTMFRVASITVPVIVDDQFLQAP